MPAYITTPTPSQISGFGGPPAKVLLHGTPGYSFGSFDDRAPAAKFQVTNTVENSANLITATVTYLGGNLPVVSGSPAAPSYYLVSTNGLSNVPNVQNSELLGENLNAQTGNGTLYYQDTTNSGTHASAPDAGFLYIPVPVIGDSSSVYSGAGRQWALPHRDGGNKQFGISWFTIITGNPASVSIPIQFADVDTAAEYTTYDTSTATGGETRSIGNVSGNFVRIGAPTISGGTNVTLAVGIQVF